MAKANREKEKAKPTGKARGDRKVFVGLVWNCATELKLILTALLLLCSFATFIQFLPARFLPFYSNTLPACSTRSSAVVAPNHSSTDAPPMIFEELLDNGVVKRSFNPVGTAAYNFIFMSAYRGGPNTFAIMGLSSKSLHVFGHPFYTCEYRSNNVNETDDTATVSVRGHKILPDWGYGRVYTTVVVNCTFPDSTAVVLDSASGGRLLLHASTNGGFDTKIKTTDTDTDTILALDEPPASWNASQFNNSSPKYDYLYCGSPLYGGLSPQRVREWIAYHVRLFGGRSHFVIHDAGGVHEEVLEVLKPWMELGFVTLQDIREQERFDAYYHNQFLVVNDCLHRYRFDAKWMFFFDIDEFIHLPGVDSFASVMDSLSEYTMFTIEQIPMSNQLCLIEDAHKANKKWGFEKLVYKNVKKVTRKDRKYAIQPRNVFATGVHISQNYQGSYRYIRSDLMSYFHYHGTIAHRREPCQRFINNDTSVVVDGIPYVRDTKLKSVASLVQLFELDTIGPRLQSTRQ